MVCIFGVLFGERAPRSNPEQPPQADLIDMLITDCRQLVGMMW